MPLNRAKELFEKLHTAVDSAVEKTGAKNEEGDKRVREIGMAEGIPLEKEPKTNWLKEWEEKQGG